MKALHRFLLGLLLVGLVLMFARLAALARTFPQGGGRRFDFALGNAGEMRSRIVDFASWNHHGYRSIQLQWADGWTMVNGKVTPIWIEADTLHYGYRLLPKLTGTYLDYDKLGGNGK